MLCALGSTGSFKAVSVLGFTPQTAGCAEVGCSLPVARSRVTATPFGQRCAETGCRTDSSFFLKKVRKNEERGLPRDWLMFYIINRSLNLPVCVQGDCLPVIASI